MNKQMLDLYSDSLISSFSHTTATGLSRSLEGIISHDKVTRFLSAEDYDSKQLWKLVKPAIRKVESSEGVIIFDDTIEEKAYTDENDLITWHFDHSLGRSVKGVNILNCVYHTQDITIPIGFQPIQKTERIFDKKKGKEVKKSSKTKNEYFREMAQVAVKDNNIKCRFILADTYF